MTLIVTPPPLTVLLPNFGTLIQGDNSVSVSNRGRGISNKLPIVVYSPDELLIEEESQEIKVPGGLNISSLLIVESLLKDTDIEKLEKKLFWAEMENNWGEDDTVRIVLLAIQILLLPLSFGSIVYLLCKNK